MGQIINGKYVKGNAIMQDAVPRPTSVWKNSDHDRQRADHQWELIPPFNRDGTPNQDFISAYPEESASEAYGFIPTSEEISKRR